MEKKVIENMEQTETAATVSPFLKMQIESAIGILERVINTPEAMSIIAQQFADHVNKNKNEEK